MASREIPPDAIPSIRGVGECPWGCDGVMLLIESWEEGGGVYRCLACDSEHIATAVQVDPAQGDLFGKA